MRSLIRIYIIVIISIIFQPGSFGQTHFDPSSLASPFAGPAGLAAGDIDMDGIEDVVAASGASGLYAYRFDASNPGSWLAYTVDNQLGSTLTAFVADIDGDGRNDIISSGWDSNIIVWYRNTGDPAVWDKKTIATGYTRPHEVFVIDLDNDGDNDVLAAGAEINQVKWWRNNGGDPITWTGQVIGDNFMGSRSMSAADYDNDGDMDVSGASLNGNEITIWENTGGDPVNWNQVTLTDQFTGSHRVQSVDMDNDGLVDILGTAYSVSEISWWKNPGGINTDWEKYIVDNELTGAVIGLAVDLDLDGDQDVIGTGQPGNLVAWYENTGKENNPWKKKMLDDSFAGAWPVCAGDFDGDYDPDFIVGGNTANELRFYENIQEGRLTWLIDKKDKSYYAGMFIPPAEERNRHLFLALPQCSDPLAYSRLRDMLIGLSQYSGGLVLVPETTNGGSPDFELDDPEWIDYNIQYGVDVMGCDPDSVYLLGMGCNGLTVMRYAEDNHERILGVVSFNPLIPELGRSEFLFYPDIPLAICSGTAHPDRENHESSFERVFDSYGKAWFSDLSGVGEDIYTGDLIEQLIDCKNFIDTVKGSTTSVKYQEVENEIRIYPNPAMDYFSIEFPNPLEVESVLTIRSILGESVFKELIVPGTYKININTNNYYLEPGVYFVGITAEGLHSWRKIILR